MIRNSNRDVGARVVEMAELEYVVRGRGYLRGKADIETLVVKSEKGTLHIPLDIGDIRFVEAKDGRGPGISALDVIVKDKAKVLTAAKARDRQLGPSQIQVVGCRINLV